MSTPAGPGSPGDPASTWRFDRAQAAIDKGQFEVAVRELSALVAGDPHRNEWRSWLAHALECAGRLDEALAQWDYLRRQPDGGDAEARHLRCALALFGRLQDENRDDEAIHLGELLQQWYPSKREVGVIGPQIAAMRVARKRVPGAGALNGERMASRGSSGTTIRHDLVWVAAFAPLTALLVNFVLAQIGLGTIWWLSLIVMLALNGAVLSADLRHLAAAGLNVASLKGWIVLIPVYLFSRAGVAGGGSGPGVVWCVLFIVTVAAPIGGQSLLPSDLRDAAPSVPPSSGGYSQDGVTLEQYAQLRPGMTEAEAFAIVGTGQEVSRSEMAGFVTVMYEWPGSGALGANMNAVFQNGRLVQKAEFGLR